MFGSIFLLAANAGATIYYVNGVVEHSGTGLSWAEAKKTISEAMNLAVSGSDIVYIAGGTYAATTTDPVLIIKPGVPITGSFDGTETTGLPVNPAANPTILDGANKSLHVVVADSVASITLLSNLVIQGGNNPSGQGAGIYINNCTRPINFNKCTIRSNRSMSGGICSYNSQTQFTKCVICNNQASQNGGGACIRSDTFAGTNNFISCTFAGNTSLADGGGLYLGLNSRGAISNCVISGNVAANGGGIYSDGQYSLTNDLIAGNHATTTGGGVYTCQSYLTIQFCTVDGNTAPTGGAFYYAYTANPSSFGIVLNCIFSNNGNSAIYAIGGNKPRLSFSLFHNNWPADYSYLATPSSGDPIQMIGPGQIDPGYGSNDRDGNPSYNLSGCASGIWSAGPVFDSASSTTLLTCAGANLEPNAIAGKVINPNVSSLTAPQCYVMANTQTTITVAGDARAFVNNGDAWQVVNYSLSGDSAAIDWGSGSSIYYDIIVTPRPQDVAGMGADGTGTANDIGAYEYPSTTIVPQAVVWLQFTYRGTQLGSQMYPYNTIDNALTGVIAGGTIKIKPGSAAVSKRITKQVRIEAPSGGARIGAN
ncbi:right-handed parallel beta-helix repeat-containing protein [bacterium]|nr:right-handed parallel beta-helix repeat-containing protein [bacterium]